MKKQVLIFAALFLFFTLALTGYSSGASEVYRGDLEKVVNYYYRPGQKEALDVEKKYAFFSYRTKARVSKDNWIKVNGEAEPVISLKILNEREASGRKFVIVSVTEQVRIKNGEIQDYLFVEEGETYNRVSSHTWTLESGKWCRLALTKMAADEIKNIGDRDVARAKVKEWLLADPFSVEAYTLLGFIKGKDQKDQSMEDIVRTLVSINQEDTGVLFLASEWSETPADAKKHLRKLKGTNAYSDAIFTVASKISDPKERLAYIEEFGMSPGLAIVKVVALEELGLRDELRKTATANGMSERINKMLNTQSPKQAARIAGILGQLLHKAGDTDATLKWLNYGITRDPDHIEIKRLRQALGQKNDG